MSTRWNVLLVSTIRRSAFSRQEVDRIGYRVGRFRPPRPETRPSREGERARFMVVCSGMERLIRKPIRNRYGQPTMRVVGRNPVRADLKLLENSAVYGHCDELRARPVLEELVNWGLPERRGRRKHTFHLSEDAYQELDRDSDYQHRKGLDETRQEQLVIDFLDSHDRVTRAGVARLCRIDASQADWLLRRMREVRKILLGQTGRYAHCVAVPELSSSESNSEKT